MEKFVITCLLPETEERSDENPEGIVYKENYFCGFQKHPNPNFANVQFIEWDTDLNFAKFFLSRYEAKRIVKQIETGEPLTIRPLTENDFNKLKTKQK